MKLISRYLLRHLFKPWAYILSGFFLVAILADLFDHFIDFMGAGAPLSQIALYYALLLPAYLPYMLPISLLLALLYAFWQLSKNSELIAMRASGFSIGQLMTPYLMVGLASSIVLLAINECFTPWATQWIRQFLHTQGASRKGSGFLVPVAYKNNRAQRIWQIGSFDTRPSSAHEMRNISLTQQRPDGSIEFRMDAARARWVDDHWWFEQTETRYFTPNDDPQGPAETNATLEMTMLSETPADFINEIKDSSERSAREIQAFITSHPDISEGTRQRLRVDYHYRLATPWLCLIAILIGVPFGTQTGRRGMGMGILFALLSFFGFYILMALCLAYGKRQLLPPLLAGWLPSMIFLAFALGLLRRIR